MLLGGDHPLGAALIRDLEDKGYIIITSVATLEAAETIESRTHGYVRALILDPSEVSDTHSTVISTYLYNSLRPRLPFCAPWHPPFPGDSRSTSLETRTHLLPLIPTSTPLSLFSPSLIFPTLPRLLYIRHSNNYSLTVPTYHT